MKNFRWSSLALFLFFLFLSNETSLNIFWRKILVWNNHANYYKNSNFKFNWKQVVPNIYTKSNCFENVIIKFLPR